MGKGDRRLPIGIQDFESIIQDEYVYVDKTTITFTVLKDKTQPLLISFFKYFHIQSSRFFTEQKFLTQIPQLMTPYGCLLDNHVQTPYNISCN